MRTRIFLMVLLILPLLVQAQTSVDRDWKTSRPTTGTVATAFHWQISPVSTPFNWTAYATTDDTTVTINVPYDWEYVVRVQAGDAMGRLGPQSEVSDPDVAVGPGPGACAKPERWGR